MGVHFQFGLVRIGLYLYFFALSIANTKQKKMLLLYHYHVNLTNGAVMFTCVWTYVHHSHFVSFRFISLRFQLNTEIRFTSVSNFSILWNTHIQYAAENVWYVCVHKFCCLPLCDMDCVSFVHRYAWAMGGGSGGQKFVTKWMKNSTYMMTTGDIEPNTLRNCHTMIVRIDYTFTSAWFDFSSS